MRPILTLLSCSLSGLPVGGAFRDSDHADCMDANGLMMAKFVNIMT